MLRFAPQYKPVLWGGRRLEALLGRRLPAGPIGESWELADLDGHASRVTAGPAAGRLLGELWRAGALGGSTGGRFPFLLKWLDTHDLLSVQVHPDERACRLLGTGSPKTEAWFVLHNDPGAFIYIGHRPGLTAAALARAAGDGTIARWMRTLHARHGDMLLVPAGTLHAIGPGYLLLEVQQPSDTTFRVHDWGRRDAQGKPRALHLEQAAASIRYRRHGQPRVRRRRVEGPRFAMRKLAPGTEVPAHLLRVFVAASGGVALRTGHGIERLALGDVVVGEPADGAVRLLGGACLLLTEGP